MIVHASMQKAVARIHDAFEEDVQFKPNLGYYNYSYLHNMNCIHNGMFYILL